MTRPLYITNARIIDGAGHAPEQGSVLIQDDRIVAVGADADRRAQHKQDADRLDVKGMTIMPGLIDTHCHLSFDDAASNPEIFHLRRNALSALVASYNLKKLIRAGVTGVLDPDSIFENTIDLRDAVEAGVVEGPRISSGCYALIPSFGGTAGRLIADRGVTGYYMAVGSRDEIIAEIRRQVKVGADWIKVHVSGIAPRYAHRGELCNWSQDELDLMVSTAHDLGVPLMAHCRGAMSTYRAAKAGFDLIFHGTAMDEKGLELIIDRKIPVCPALTFQANVADFGEKLGTDKGFAKLFEREIIDSVETMKALYKAGVPLLTGSEAGFSMVPYGHWHYREMEVFTRYFGLTNLQAIQCGTETSAFGLKMAGQTGVVAPGYKADLICVDGDPSHDITILGEPGRIRHVWIDGRAQDLSPLPTHRALPGWRMPSMGLELTRELAFGPAGDAKIDTRILEELH